MRITVDHAYQHPADAVFAVLTDFDEVRAKYEAVGQREHRASSRATRATAGR